MHVLVQTNDGEGLAEHSFADTDAWQTSLLPGSYTVRVQTLGGAERIETLVVPAAGTTFSVR